MTSKKLIRFPQRLFFPLLIAIVSILLAACGGGTQTSSNGDVQAVASPSTTPQSQSLTLSGSVASNMAASAFTVSEFLFNPAEFASGFVPELAPTDTLPAASTLAIDMDESGWADLRLNASPTSPVMQPCAGGGSLTSVASTQLARKLLDTITVVATNCTDHWGVTYKGTLISTTVSQQGSPLMGKEWDTTSIYRFKGFSAESMAGKAQFDGDLTVNKKYSPVGNRTYVLSGDVMHIIGQRTGQAPNDVTIRQYKTFASFAPGDIRSTIEFTQQSVGSSGQAGTVVVKTPQTFIRTAGAYSSSGVLSVSDGVSTATVTAKDGTTVQVDYSPAGDGVVTESNTLTWSQFLSPK
jgi:hypothetical protein